MLRQQVLKRDEGAAAGAGSWLTHARELAEQRRRERATSRASAAALNGGVNTATMRASESSANIVAE